MNKNAVLVSAGITKLAGVSTDAGRLKAVLREQFKMHVSSFKTELVATNSLKPSGWYMHRNV